VARYVAIGKRRRTEARTRAGRTWIIGKAERSMSTILRLGG
jgi:hypothetical protein